MAKIADEFSASEKQIRQAYARALRRTASNLKTQSRKEIRQALGLRSAGPLRRRLQGFRYHRGGGGMGGVRMWFGMNPIAVSSFKGRVAQTAAGAARDGVVYRGSFVAKNSKGRRTIMRRRGAARYPIVEEAVDVSDEMEAVIEAEVWGQIEEVFFGHFLSEIRARTIYGVGK